MKTFSWGIKRKAAAGSRQSDRPAAYGSALTRQTGAIRRILGRPRLQAQLTVGAPDDAYEQEADRVAEAVMRMPEEALARQPQEEEEEELLQPKTADREACCPDLQRQVEEEEEELLQPKHQGGEAVVVGPDLEHAITARQGGGQPLSEGSRSFFEPRMGLDLSAVQIHTGAQAAEWTRMLNARAFTLGSDIFFGAGQFAPETMKGKRLLAHELTHTVQQGNGVRRSREYLIRREAGDEEAAGEEAPTLTNQRFVGDRALELILTGRLSRLSTRHNGRRGAVSKVQQALVDLGFELPMYLVDGQYGDETEEALRQFRDQHGPSPGNQLDGATLAVLDRVAPQPGVRHEHTVDYDRLLEDGRLDVTVAIGATDTMVRRRTDEGQLVRTERPTEDLMAERFRNWMQGQGFRLELLGLSGNEYWKGTRTITWTDASGGEQHREVDIWINLVVPSTGAAREFGQGLSQDEITIYTGHARYGSGPDFDAKASPLENFRIGIDSALQAAGRRTRVEEARRHGVAVDEEHHLLDMVRGGDFDPNRYRVLFFNACTSLAYLDEIREHVGGTDTADVIATRRPSLFSDIETEVSMEETQHFLEGLFAAESVESIISGLDDLQRRLHRGSQRFPQGGIFTSSGLGDNPRVP